METNKTHSIRPAGRHILTIGRDLIQDKYAAIVELVKNAYDADSPYVSITFKAFSERTRYSIVIEDNGHGMSRDTVIKRWMVPSTDDKLKRRESPNGRIMQGRKGIGRYAASILGENLLLETIADKVQTTVYVEWVDFEEAKFLDEVEILIESKKTDISSGTRLTITGGREYLNEWDQVQIDKLKFELKKLKSPIDNALSGEKRDDTFEIRLTFDNFLTNQMDIVSEIIEPYPIIDLYDYRIAGRIDTNGKGSLIYSTLKARNTIEENILYDFQKPTECGELIIDIRVYDRDKESIESLIGRGLKDESGNYVSKLQARQLLTKFNGIGVYRNGFRIRPLGEADFDWLKLNEQRVQNPSMRIGSNQVIGFVLIQNDEISNLKETSARDGLKDNTAYENLKTITKEVISELEQRRFIYRKKAGLSRSALKFEQELEKLFDFDELRQDISAKLKKSGVDNKAVNEIIQIINKEEEEKHRITEDIRRAVAIYQGQATVGKIINVILHEGRRPLNYFKNQIPNLKYFFESFQKKQNMETVEKIIPVVEGIYENADVFATLFSRIDPLASGKRGKRKPIPLRKTIERIFDVFNKEIERNSITIKVEGPVDFKFLGWNQDIYSIFTNLIDNSIYWMIDKKSKYKEITITIETNGHELQFIDYHDTGPGIEPNLIESEVIFEPDFTTKQKGTGTGIGLAIAGEAASRNGLELKAFESESGAYFRLQPNEEN